MSVTLNDDLAYQVLSVVEEILPGSVATCGKIARLIGHSRHSRLVARVLSHAHYYGSCPCHRVVDHSDRLAPGRPEQAALLQQEGVALKDENHVDLRRFGWKVG